MSPSWRTVYADLRRSEQERRAVYRAAEQALRNAPEIHRRERSVAPDTAPPAAFVSFVQSVAYGVAAAVGVTVLTLVVGLLWR